MKASTQKFFRNGTDNQKTADVIIDLRRMDIKKIKQWNEEQKEELRNFMLRARNSFEEFYEDLTHNM